jgi:hypothetical protein
MPKQAQIAKQTRPNKVKRKTFDEMSACNQYDSLKKAKAL